MPTGAANGNVSSNNQKANWPPIGTHPLLRLDQQSELKPNGFMDFSGFSNRTISAQEMDRYTMVDPNQSNQDVSYQKITTPAFYINQYNVASGNMANQKQNARKPSNRRDNTRAGQINIKEKMPHQQMILGMVDSDENIKSVVKSGAIHQQQVMQHK